MKNAIFFFFVRLIKENLLRIIIASLPFYWSDVFTGAMLFFNFPLIFIKLPARRLKITNRWPRARLKKKKKNSHSDRKSNNCVAGNDNGCKTITAVDNEIIDDKFFGTKCFSRGKNTLSENRNVRVGWFFCGAVSIDFERKVASLAAKHNNIRYGNVRMLFYRH